MKSSYERPGYTHMPTPRVKTPLPPRFNIEVGDRFGNWEVDYIPAPNVIQAHCTNCGMETECGRRRLLILAEQACWYSRCRYLSIHKPSQAKMDAWLASPARLKAVLKANPDT